MTGVAIRSGQPEDLPGILALYRHLHPDDPDLDPTVAASVWAALLACGLTTVVVAEMVGSLVASCTLAIIPNLSRGGRPYGIIENVVTHPDHRRMGLGRGVLQFARDRADETGCYKVVLATGSRQDATLAFYESAGFRRGGKTYFEARYPWDPAHRPTA